jgi:hypothetical protein
VTLFRWRLFAMAWLLWAALQPAVADEMKPSWACVPEDAVALVRVPGGQAYADALRTQTRLGGFLLDAERLQRFVEAIGEEGREKYDEFVQKLGKYGLKLSDAGNLFAGEAGYSLLLVGEGDARVPVGLAWLEPEGDLAERLLAALEKLIEDQPAEENAVRRVDLELAGRSVIQLSEPVIRVKGGADEDAAGKNDDDRAAGPDALGRVMVGHFHVLIARLGSRLVLAHDWGPTTAEVKKRLKVDNPAEESEAAALEEVHALFARFLAAHDEADTSPKLRLAETPGLSAALPAGVPLLEILADPRPLVKLADTPDGQRVFGVLKALAIDQIGPLAYRVALDHSVMRSGMFLSAPAPRTGILTLLDQPPLRPQPPAWVPADIVSFGQVSFDLGKAYSRLRELLLAELGAQIRPGLELVENQFQQFLQTDVPSALSSLGTEHSAINFMPEKEQQKPADRKSSSVMGFSDRTGLVWQVKDEALWTRILQLGAASGGMSMVEEQGFNGLRIQHGEIDMAVFLGRGYLVVGTGPGVVEPILSALRNPPAGESSLAASPLFARASELLPPEPCLSYSWSDTNRYLKVAHSVIASSTSVITDSSSAPAELKRLARALESFMPSEEELDGVFGVSVTQTVVTDHGLVNRSALELPAGP